MEEEAKNLLDKANFSKSTFPDHLQRLEVVGTELGTLQSGQDLVNVAICCFYRLLQAVIDLQNSAYCSLGIPLQSFQYCVYLYFVVILQTLP